MPNSHPNYLKKVLEEHNIPVAELHAKILQFKARDLSYTTLLNITNNKTPGNRNSQNKIVHALKAIIQPKTINREDVFPNGNDDRKIIMANVFKTVGVPDATFVKPNEYNEIRAVINSSACLSIEGPSGIGKTSCLRRLLIENELFSKYAFFSGRVEEDLTHISEIASGKRTGLHVIDDVHRLDETMKAKLTSRLKYIAEKETRDERIIILGINKVERSLFASSPDLVGRVKTIKFKQVSPDKLQELVKKGENALNIEFKNKNEIIEACEGSFQLLQSLCNIACSQAGIFEKQESLTKVPVDIQRIKDQLFDELANAFLDSAKKIATGGLEKPQAGRAHYLSLLRMLSQTSDNSISLADIRQEDPNVYDVLNILVNNGDLIKHLNQEVFSNLIYFDHVANTIYAEDPKFFYYLKNLNWADFAKKCGFSAVNFSWKYDYALSFASSEMQIAERIAKELNAQGIPTFYYVNEQSNMLGGNIGDYLKPVYENESHFIIPIISNTYANNFWTRFEAGIIRDLIKESRVLPILVDGAYIGIFAENRDITSLVFKTESDLAVQVQNIVRTLADFILANRNK